MGRLRFVTPKTVEVTLNDGGNRVLAGEKVFINIGTRAAIPDIPGTPRSKASDAYLAFTPARSLSIARVSLVSALPPWQVSSSSASASGFA